MSTAYSVYDNQNGTIVIRCRKSGLQGLYYRDGTFCHGGLYLFVAEARAVILASARAAVVASSPGASVYHDRAESDPAERYVILSQDGFDVLGSGRTPSQAWVDASSR